jgi:hypothetical protein
MVTTATQYYPDDTPSIFRFLGITQFLRWRGFYIGCAEITPEQAAYLWSLKHSNRTFNAKQAKKYAKDMRAGRWAKLASMISFAGERMVDGQTRDDALMTSQTTQSFVIVVRPEDDAGNFDIGNQRRVADFLDLEVSSHFQGVSKFAIAATTPGLAVYFLWAHGSSENYQLRTRLEEVELIAQDRVLTVFAVQCRRNWEKRHNSQLPAAALAALLECYKFDPVSGAHYAEAVTTEAGVEFDSPPNKVTTWIRNHIGRGKQMPTATVYWNKVVMGYDAYRRGAAHPKKKIPTDTFLRPKGDDR